MIGGDAVYGWQKLDICSSYLRNAFDHGKKIIDYSVYDLSFIDFDTLVIRGLSGLLVAPEIARRLDKHVLVVRKSVASHGNPYVEGTIGNKWIFFDDFVSSGATRDECLRVVSGLVYNYQRHETTFIGSYEYIYRRLIWDQAVAPWDSIKPPVTQQRVTGDEPFIPRLVGAEL